MECDTKFSEVRHAPGLRSQLNLVSGLPFEQVLSAQVVVTAIEQQGIKYRERFFLPTKRFGPSYPKSLMTISPARRPSHGS